MGENDYGIINSGFGGHNLSRKRIISSNVSHRTKSAFTEKDTKEQSRG